MAMNSSPLKKTLMPCLAVACFFLMFSFSDATDFVLAHGKESLWRIPSHHDDLNKWAEKERFRIGDSIVVKYDASLDSVLQVSKEDYVRCDKANPIKTYTDGDSKIAFYDSGAFYFISGAEGHCERGQKLEVKVLSAKHGGGHDHDGTAAAPSPAAYFAPAPSPTGAAYGLTAGISGLGMVFASIFGLLSA